VYNEFSITRDGSLIDRINAFQRRDTLFCFNDSSGLFAGLYDPLRDVWRKSGGYYDPTLRPIKRAWADALASSKSRAVEPNLDSLYEFVGFDYSNFDVIEQFDSLDVYRETQIRKRDPRTEIDFGKALFAYALDHVAYFFKERGLENFQLQLGTTFISSQQSADSLGYVNVQLPDTLVSEDLDIKGQAFVFHTASDKVGLIDATYGFPVENNIEYVGVIAPTALKAEAFATAFLSMGIEEVMKFYGNYPDEPVDALILYRDNGVLQSASTNGFDKRLVHVSAQSE